MAEIYSGWVDEYPLLSIEDPFDEDDWGSWNLLTKNIGKDCQIVGDDLYVTQVKTSCINPSDVKTRAGAG